MSNKSRARKNRHKPVTPAPEQKLHFADLDINLMYPWTIESLVNLK